MRYHCLECGLPDLYDGYGDGIGSCECPRCEVCGAQPGMCSCDEDYDDDMGDLRLPACEDANVTGERL